MWLTREEMLRLGWGKDMLRAHASVAPGIDPNNPEDREKVLKEMDKAAEAIRNGEYEPMTDF